MMYNVSLCKWRFLILFLFNVECIESSGTDIRLAVDKLLPCEQHGFFRSKEDVNCSKY